MRGEVIRVETLCIGTPGDIELQYLVIVVRERHKRSPKQIAQIPIVRTHGLAKRSPSGTSQSRKGVAQARRYGVHPELKFPR